MILADLNHDALDRTRDALLSQGVPDSHFAIQQVDVAEFAQVQQLAQFAHAHFGKHVDVLVLNAGIQIPTKDFSHEPEANLAAWNKVLGVNAFGVLHGTQAFVDGMVKQGKPAAVIITGSKQGITQPPYVCSSSQDLNSPECLTRPLHGA